MHALGWTPTSVLAGLFLFMGEQSLATNPILYRVFDMISERDGLKLLPKGVRWRAVNGYTLFQIIVTVGIFVVTFTKGAAAFPIVIVAFVPFRLQVMNRIWRREVLMFVDSWACRPGVVGNDFDGKGGNEGGSESETGDVDRIGDEEEGSGRGSGMVDGAGVDGGVRGRMRREDEDAT